MCACSLAASHCCGAAGKPVQAAEWGRGSRRSRDPMQGVLGCLMQPHWQNDGGCWRLPIVWPTDCLRRQDLVAVRVDMMHSFPAGLKGIYQGGAGQHEAPAAHSGSCKVKLCITRLLVLHIAVYSSGCKMVTQFYSPPARTLTAVTRVLWVDLPITTKHC